MQNKDFFEALEDLQREKNIDKDFIISALESALTVAYKKNMGEAKSAEVRLYPDKNTIKIFSYKTIVEVVEDSDKEISLEEAQKIKASYKIGEVVANEESTKDFNRIAVQTAKQVIVQKIKELERQELHNDIAEKEGKLIVANVRRIDGSNIYLEIGGTNLEGLLTERDVLPNDNFRIGDRVKVFVRPSRDEMRSHIVQVTRTNVSFVKKLMELEIPEIQNGAITIVNAVRDPGNRTKVAISTTDRTLDAVGACIGNKGMRITSVVNELHGEKIDIVLYSENTVEYIVNALNPAQIYEVQLDENNQSAKVMVPETKLSLAIGKGGQNVRLAAKLTGYKLDVKGVPVQEEHKTSPDTIISEGANIIVDDNNDIFDDIE
ncbi:MAG: transcription termination factor NusA [Clostridia bacterium]|nr:transcription termination factor NusA [Clostridia bacterium]